MIVVKIQSNEAQVARDSHLLLYRNVMYSTVIRFREREVQRINRQKLMYVRAQIWSSEKAKNEICLYNDQILGPSLVSGSFHTVYRKTSKIKCQMNDTMNSLKFLWTKLCPVEALALLQICSQANTNHAQFWGSTKKESKTAVCNR